MALRLELLDERANLTDERIDAAVAAAVQRAQMAIAARLRG
jgi:phenylalanyl-tRNA synthetase beta chain